MPDDPTPPEDHPAPGGRPTSTHFARRALIAACISAGVVAALLLLWYAVDVVMLVFAGILFGVFLRGLSLFVSKRVGLSREWSLAVVLIGIALVIFVAGWLLADRVSQQANELVEQLPRAVANLTARLEASAWGKRLTAQMPDAGEVMRGRGSVLDRITGIFSGALGALANFIVIIVLGCYLAAEPRTYTRGIIHLIPRPADGDADRRNPDALRRGYAR